MGCISLHQEDNKVLDDHVKSLEAQNRDLHQKRQKGEQDARDAQERRDAKMEKLQKEIDELKEVNAHMNTQVLHITVTLQTKAELGD